MNLALYKECTPENHKKWQNIKIKGKLTFQINYSIKHFLPVFYPPCMIGFVLMYTAQEMDIVGIWKPALIMLVTGILAGIATASTVWKDTNSVFQQHLDRISKQKKI